MNLICDTATKNSVVKRSTEDDEDIGERRDNEKEREKRPTHETFMTAYSCGIFECYVKKSLTSYGEKLINATGENIRAVHITRAQPRGERRRTR